MPTRRYAEEQEFIHLMVRLNRGYRRALNRVLAGQGLSDAQALPVMFIARLGDGIRPGVLAETLGIEGPSLVRQLDQLCAAGLVERRSDPNDRRAKTLYLSEAGRVLAAKIEELASSFRARMLAHASDDELAITLRVLSTLEARVESELTHQEAGSAR